MGVMHSHYRTGTILRPLLRLILFASFSIASVIKLIIYRALPFTRNDPMLGMKTIQNWSRRVNRALGVHVHVEGPLPSIHAMIASNHRSYMDITVMGEVLPTTFLAKQEVRQWPIIGYGCSLADVIFVERENPESRIRALALIREQLELRGGITIHPEGTTTAGPGIVPMKRGSFRMAAEGGFPVVPCALWYEDPNDAWIGDDTFFRHFFQAFRKKRIDVHIRFGEPRTSSDPDELLNKTESWIKSTLGNK